MKENDEAVKLLMEETGCERREAELALSLTNNNIEQAIATIGFLLKFITVFKIKLMMPKENIYALALIALNMKTVETLRFCAVFSLNPAIYEVSTSKDWFSFEKAVFSARLSDGAMESYTQGIEENLKLYIQQTARAVAQIAHEEIKTIIQSFFEPTKTIVEVVSEELNLTQFKKLPDYALKKNEISPTGYDVGFIKLDTELLEDLQGKPANAIQEGDTVLSLITDERDIAHYIANLIGARKGDTIIPLAAVVKKVTSKNDDYEIHLHYAPSITGYAKINKDSKIKVLDTSENPWWKKIVPW
ncbi:hypothetical protein [Endomicrobium proavitum]|uniref:Uncharacterized protein n=1 Tax=Endomicrobium proavitum TaxID=1408281 RepID=A0A0G3WJ38_9BACT|nr:hypothetical protein [Endomicrobium proavitum]AKL98343.1 hypothetical protein Epro_0964 [Endomicrobium proavitum]